MLNKSRTVYVMYFFQSKDVLIFLNIRCDLNAGGGQVARPMILQHTNKIDKAGLYRGLQMSSDGWSKLPSYLTSLACPHKIIYKKNCKDMSSILIGLGLPFYLLGPSQNLLLYHLKCHCSCLIVLSINLITFKNQLSGKLF